MSEERAQYQTGQGPTAAEQEAQRIAGAIGLTWVSTSGQNSTLAGRVAVAIQQAEQRGREAGLREGIAIANAQRNEALSATGYGTTSQEKIKTAIGISQQIAEAIAALLPCPDATTPQEKPND